MHRNNWANGVSCLLCLVLLSCQSNPVNTYQPEADIFYPGTTTMRPEAADALAPLGEMLHDYSDKYSYRIHVYVNDQGSLSDQLKLTQDQAEIIASYMWANFNVPLDNFIEISGKGSQKPVANPNSPQGNSTNRRISVIYEPK